MLRAIPMMRSARPPSSVHVLAWLAVFTRLASAQLAPLPMPAKDDLISFVRTTRRLATITVQPGVGTLQAAHDAANAGDELVLADGSYTGSGADAVLTITKSLTIRALNPRGAILDGEDARRLILSEITSGTIAFEGLDITRGLFTAGMGVRAHTRP